MDRTVKVDKSKLVERLKENRDRHEREYQEAVGGYKARLVFVLTRMLEAAKKKEDLDHRIDMEVPQSHIADYDKALAIMEWEQEDTLKLSVCEFERFVLDQWPWKEHFTKVHASYIAPQQSKS